MITTTLANKIWNIVTAKATSESLSGTGQCWLGFSSTTPKKDGSNFTEPNSSTYPSYHRIQLNINSAQLYTSVWGNVENGMVQNDKEICSPECLEEGGWPEFTHFGIFGAETGGSLLCADYLTDPDGEPDATTGRYPKKSLKVNKDSVAVFRAGTLKLKFFYEEDVTTTAE